MNSKNLKDIIARTESKVKRTLKGFHSISSSQNQNTRNNLDSNFIETQEANEESLKE